MRTRGETAATLRIGEPMLRPIVVLVFLVGFAAHAGDLESYLTGELAGLEPLEKRVSLAGHQIVYPDGETRALEAKSGKVLLVNLWARWCVPCKEEMKGLASLQRDLGDDRFEVMALPMKKRSIKSARKILKSWGAENLEPYGNDPQALARVLFDEGLFTEREITFVYPTTYLVGKNGEILAIREGFLEWDTPEARALITALKNDAL
jgi:thiol-disulfide isomerase/thioredoxin